MKSDNQECKEAILIWTGRRVGVAEMGGKAVAAEEGGMAPHSPEASATVFSELVGQAFTWPQLAGRHAGLSCSG